MKFRDYIHFIISSFRDYIHFNLGRDPRLTSLLLLTELCSQKAHQLSFTSYLGKSVQCYAGHQGEGRGKADLGELCDCWSSPRTAGIPRIPGLLCLPLMTTDTADLLYSPTVTSATFQCLHMARKENLCQTGTTHSTMRVAPSIQEHSSTHRHLIL